MSIEQFTALSNLLSTSNAQAYINAIDEFWESWLTNEVNDGLTADERSEKLYLYKNLRIFLKNIS